VESDQSDDVAEMNVRFPTDILHLDLRWPAGKRTKGTAGKSAHYTDAWGCTWQLGSRGGVGPLVESPLTDVAKVAEYEPPAELLEAGRFTKVNRSCEGTTRFALAWSEVRPLDRLQFLRGAEALVAELSGSNKELRRLLGRIDEFFRRELELWGRTEVDGVVICDDLGGPSLPRISPKIWRNLLKPLYSQYCNILHAQDKFAFFHGEGPITDVLGDLVEVGFDAVHCQLFQTDFDKLAEQYRGRVTFWSEIDGRTIEPAGSVQAIRETVLRVRKALDFGAGGVIARYLWAPGTPLRNVVAFFEPWMIPLPVAV
jgi:uroporphyrinogen decarboxylase